jgi:putative transposase
MPRMRYTPEQIINKLRQAEVLVSQGRSVREIAKELGISEHTYYRWRKEYGADQAKRLGKLLSPERRRAVVNHAMERYQVSERRACRVLGQPRSTQRYQIRRLADEELLTVRICELAAEYGRYGYRRVTSSIVAQRHGKYPVVSTPMRKNHVWSYDFVHDRTYEGKAYRILVVIDEYTRECLSMVCARRLNADAVIHTLTELFCNHGTPEYIRSDNGAEFTSLMVRKWLASLEVSPLYIEPGSPWENGYVESFNGKLRDEFLNRERFYTLREAQVLLEQWRRHYNTKRPHSALGYRPPAPEARSPLEGLPAVAGLS